MILVKMVKKFSFFLLIKFIENIKFPKETKKLDENELKQLLLELFSKQEFFTLRELEERTGQTKVFQINKFFTFSQHFLSKILQEICDKNKGDGKARKFCLKSYLKSVKL